MFQPAIYGPVFRLVAFAVVSSPIHRHSPRFGHFGGKPTSRFELVEVVWAFPPLQLGITIMAFLGQGLFNLILALVVQRWIPYCRVVRGQALSLRTREFVVASRCLGARNAQIILRHILPNVIQTSLVIGTFAMASAIIAEASLSFLNVRFTCISHLGARCSPMRVSTSARSGYFAFPGLYIFVTVLGINLLGDASAISIRLKRASSGI
jgi:peptide/nickel transport system permease protein